MSWIAAVRAGGASGRTANRSRAQRLRWCKAVSRSYAAAIDRVNRRSPGSHPQLDRASPGQRRSPGSACPSLELGIARDAAKLFLRFAAKIAHRPFNSIFIHIAFLGSWRTPLLSRGPLWGNRASVGNLGHCRWFLARPTSAWRMMAFRMQPQAAARHRPCAATVWPTEQMSSRSPSAVSSRCSGSRSYRSRCRAK